MAARTNNKANSKNPKDWQKFDFCEIRLDELQKGEFKKTYRETPNVYFDELDTLTKNGYKFSITYDGNNNCVIASMTCKEPRDPNFNYVMTARAGDAFEALALVLFKHLRCCDDGEWPIEEQTGYSNWG